MTTRDLVHAVRREVKRYGFSNLVESDGTNSVAVCLTTTQTRATAVGSRISLIVQELACGRHFEVRKHLMSVPPKRREDIRPWRIVVKVLSKKDQLSG